MKTLSKRRLHVRDNPGKVEYADGEGIEVLAASQKKLRATDRHWRLLKDLDSNLTCEEIFSHTVLICDYNRRSNVDVSSLWWQYYPIRDDSLAWLNWDKVRTTPIQKAWRLLDLGKLEIVLE